MSISLIDFYNYRVVAQYFPNFAVGIGTTLWVSVVTLFFGLIIGTMVALCRTSKNPILRQPAAFYIQCIRSTPLLVQIYVVYFGLPALPLINRRLDEMEGGILALSINAGAYLAEIIRAGIESIDRGQIEAALASGLTYMQRMRYIILPQAMAKVVPPILGHAAIVIKDSSLLCLITVFELMSAGLKLMSDFIMPTEAFLTVAAGYLSIYFMMLYISNKIQNKLRGQRQMEVRI
ncbi:MAG: amino acid ABC transporter permease [Deltaproteobacteria bacterium]|jgi:polar amino acid transport system permease protein|nr:amino acid ABC transporter permease [Deltaproteobacteria bacterium]MBT4092078.1 amino acid ABC transporter permease [Deltaproteobacteria bacterium]MBT4267114.1 amino acid ABC transporter permease [Deltaproteobacteria bacterium]MBT4643029.1 amino acid ABC transporter permease [Deltaproteobacteria bacterium]MBT6504933.1 amino acid ABC transporter permease [Deltaproteobacteria bacterium]